MSFTKGRKLHHQKESTHVTNVAIIMAGGAGTRFWPASRSTQPKQLLPLLGGATSMLAHTVERILPLVAAEHIYVVTGESIAQATKAAIPQIPPSNILCEPTGRNTAPCIGWASWVIAKRHPGARVMVLPSDHHIGNPDAFRAALLQALETASEGLLTTIGIVPTRAETGYGYIEVGDALPANVPNTPSRETGSRQQEAHARIGLRFVEKPSRERAQAYLDGGKHLWNAGMFFFRVSDMADAIRTHLPELASGLDTMTSDASSADPSAVSRIFPTLPSISIDHGVMEKVPRLAVVPGEFGWSDVGSFLSAWELAKKDENQNGGPAVVVEGQGNYSANFGKARQIALVGVSDLVVVCTDDAVIVVPRERSQDVKLAIEAIKKQGDPLKVL
jgi:mannose-1-phosphate guanylyltransferase